MSFLNVSRQNLKVLELHDEEISYLNASNNLLTSTWGIHSSVCLKEIDMSYNLVRQIEGWGFLTSLQIVDMNHNRLITTFGFRNCAKIHTLMLRGNFLRRIEGLEGLIDLKYLDISHNQMNEVSSIRPLSINTNLQILYLEGNPLPPYRQHCYTMLLSLSLLDGSPTPPSNSNKLNSIRNSYSLRRKPSCKPKAAQPLSHRCKSAMSNRN